MLKNIEKNHKVKDESNEECFSKYLKETLCRCRMYLKCSYFIRVHTFLFMAPQTQLPSFISYCCLHKNTISGLHMIEASVQAARSKKNNFSNNIYWNMEYFEYETEASIIPAHAVDSCVLLLICALSLIKLKYFPTFFVS